MESGEGEDVAMGVAWLKESMEFEGDAVYNLGIMCLDGRLGGGVPLAVRLFRQAAAMGSSFGIQNLAVA